MSERHWLVKTEPSEFSITDLKNRGDAGEPWDGIRNYQARNFLREMKQGDIVFIYHSSCAVPGIVGSAVVTREAYPDPGALDQHSKYFDPKSSPENNRWSVVEMQFWHEFKDIISLKTIKSAPELSEMFLVKRSRLSVMPVTPAEYEFIMQLQPASK